MTDAEIVRHYQEAANKTKDIKVLAELNLCAPADIRAILAAAGVPGVKPPALLVTRPQSHHMHQHTEQLQLLRVRVPDRLAAAGAQVPGLVHPHVLLWLGNDRHFRRVLLAADLVSILMCGAWVSVLLRVLEAAE